MSGDERRCLKKLVAHSDRVRGMPTAVTVQLNSDFKKAWDQLASLVGLNLQHFEINTPINEKLHSLNKLTNVSEPSSENNFKSTDGECLRNRIVLQLPVMVKLKC